MEKWSIGVMVPEKLLRILKASQDQTSWSSEEKHLFITPSLQYSITPRVLTPKIDPPSGNIESPVFGAGFLLSPVDAFISCFYYLDFTGMGNYDSNNHEGSPLGGPVSF